MGQSTFSEMLRIDPAQLCARQALYLLYYLSGPSTKYFYRKKACWGGGEEKGWVGIIAREMKGAEAIQFPKKSTQNAIEGMKR